MDEASGRAGSGGYGGPRLLTLLALLLLVLFSSAVRVRTALADANFAAGPREGLLKSDPALLVYLTARVAGARGLVPDDFRADPRVQHPLATDLPAELTVGQELLVGWLYRWLGGGEPLERFVLVAMALCASAALVGAYLLARELTGSRAWGLFAAALFACLPANHRSIGFVIVREDLSFPLFAAHLGLLAALARRPSRARALACGACLAGALATWHAAGFLLALELAALGAWFLRRGVVPLERAGAWLVCVPPLAACVLVPALATAGVAFSAPTALVWAWALAAAWGRLARRPGPRARTLVALGLVALALVLAGRGERAGYAHVWEVLAAKLRCAGRFPWEDPGSISFDARLLWQGPFATLELPWFVGLQPWALLGALPLLPWGAACWARREGRSGPALLALGLALAAGAAWAFERLQILPGLLAPPACALVLARLRAPRPRALAVVCLLGLQASRFAAFLHGHVNLWYVPAVRQQEIAALVGWARAELGPDEPVLCDFVNGPALLAQVGTPIALHPKYETAESRRRAEAFLDAFFRGTPADLARLARERFAARVVVVDRYTLWELSRATAGLPLSARAPAPGTAAAWMLSQDDATLASVPGFRLLYRSPDSLRGEGGAPSDFFRVFRVE